ncbi:MAG TPA: MFS transporter [Burkholderiales bacterium]|nr:MFS transporter [Burkholderiales bacterium]
MTRAEGTIAMTARQRLIAVLLLGSNFMLSVDFSILNIALPEVGRAIGLDLANLAWVMTVFALPAAGMSLLFGRLGDLYGRRRLFLIGLSLLAAASLLGGVSTGPAALLAARALQGMAVAMTAPAALALFIRIERRATAPLVAIGMLARPSVRWGNLAVLIIFSMEAGLVFLMTLYIQAVLRFGPLATGLIFGVPGLASAAAGIFAGRIIARRGARPVLVVALLVQGGLTAPLILLGTESTWLWLLIPALFVGFLGHITAVVAATVIATSEVGDADAGLATGLVTTSQRIAVTIGIPILGAVMALRADLLAGIHVALVVDVLLTLTVVAILSAGLIRLHGRYL